MNDIIHEGSVYDIIILDEETSAEKECNYGIVHRKYQTIESMCSALFMAYELLNELETNLEKSKPTNPLKVVK